MLLREGIANTKEQAKTRVDSMSASQHRQLLYNISADDLLTYYKASSIGMLSFPSNIQDDTVLPKGNLLQNLSRLDGKDSSSAWLKLEMR